MKLADVKSVVRSGTMSVDGPGDTVEEVQFRYKPNAYTPELEQSSREDRKSEYAADIYIALLLPVLEWVDFQDDNGKDVEITPEGLRQVPINMLQLLVQRVNEEMDPGKKKSGASGGSFRG